MTSLTSCSHWKNILRLCDPPRKLSPSNHTWNPPWRTLQCEHALRQEVRGRSKFTKVTFEMVSFGVLGVFIPPSCGSPVLMDVCEITRVSWGRGGGEGGRRRKERDNFFTLMKIETSPSPQCKVMLCKQCWNTRLYIMLTATPLVTQ